METDDLWQVTTPWLCAGIVTREGWVTEAAPILGWTVGKSILHVQTWAKRRGGACRIVPS